MGEIEWTAPPEWLPCAGRTGVVPPHGAGANAGRAETDVGSLLGVVKGAARRLGLTQEEYEARIAAGEKWCTRCKAWHPREAFGRDSTRGDGLTATCVAARNNAARAAYEPGPRVSRLGTHLVPGRDGDKEQARARVNHAVDAGLLPDPNDCACADCGHAYVADGGRHEYHHDNGYGATAHLDVVALCTKCHARRHRGERSAA